MKVLYLTLTKKWFDMIYRGEKPEEYREIKPYWVKRFDNADGTLKDFDIVRFTNGYGKDKPSFDIKLVWLRVGKGQPEWGAEPGKRYYILCLGDKISERNIN